MRYTFLLIVALLLLTTVLPYEESTQKVSADSLKGFTKKELSKNKLSPLIISAGKKKGYTQQQLDSLENINLIRKKF